MNAGAQRTVYEGYMILRVDGLTNYRGVDRHCFEPTLLEQETIPSASIVSGHLWTSQKAAWRRAAFKLFEEAAIANLPTELQLLSDAAVAERIVATITPHMGAHEVASCKIWQISTLHSSILLDATDSWGIDIAYLGGDFYSAVKNGLHLNPDADLCREFSRHLNLFGLFTDVKIIERYVKRFKETVKSEADSEFYAYVMA